MLWTTTHAPEGCDDIVQEGAREALGRVAEGRLNAVIYGPEGSGKTAATEVLARQEFENGEANLFTLNAADFFGMTKKEISNDPRFEGFIGSKRRRESSKADMINHVLKEIASHPTVGDERKMVVVDDASEMRRDFQQALRRVMERYSDTCQFVLTTRSLTALIPAIQSRCFPVPFRSPSKERVAERLKEIAEAEGVEYDDGGVEYVAEAADGNLREGILLLQTVAVTEGEVRMNTAYDVIEGVGNEDVEEMLEDAYSGDFDSAVERLDDLLIDEGYSGRELLERVLEASEEHDSERAARLVDTVGEIDARMSEGANPRIHLESLLSSVSE